MDFGGDLNYAITQIKFKCSYLILLNISKQLWQECLNSDTQQIHQCQQNKQPPLTSNHWTKKAHDIWRWNPGIGTKNFYGAKPINKIPSW